MHAKARRPNHAAYQTTKWMMESGIRRKSTSLWSSSVHLVYKKEHTTYFDTLVRWSTGRYQTDKEFPSRKVSLIS